ncbi:cell division protein FtsL [Bacillus sp. REN16]|uniref:cell division protein FtsL n=1 Tax=Bacillus sp. REN16 TaxID=2887296 RepID=UPI001E4B8223|nr:cell division protein FtsL [Bacillus sp. REN16]MCC3357571.1 cell division protein FtsL [Bacillus sp. REN16]
MGNLAYKVRQTENYQPNQSPKTQPTRKKFRFSLGEKVLGIIFFAAVIFCAIHIISNQVSIYHTNIEIQKIEASINQQTKTNSDLYVQVQELSEYERLWEKARELGLDLKENNVKVVQGN